MEESFGSIRKVWMEAGTTYCTSIPLEIVKKLELGAQDMLYVDLVDELIVMKKHNVHFTKNEIQKVKDMSNKAESNDSENINDNTSNIAKENEEESNPLDGHEF